jgi:hypothetical protein
MSATLAEARHYHLRIEGTSERQVAETLARLAGVDGYVVKKFKGSGNPGYPTAHRVFSGQTLRRLGRDLQASDALLEVNRERVYFGSHGLTEWQRSDCYGVTSRIELPEYVQGQATLLLEEKARSSVSRRFVMALFGGR